MNEAADRHQGPLVESRLGSATPRVTVLLTTHGSPYLAEAIGSVLAQSLSALELVVVDDASTDGTALLLEGIRDPRLRVIRAGERSGVAGARNLGFAAARAPLVAMLDHDDRCHPDRLAAQARAMEADARLVLCGSAVRVERDGWGMPGHVGAAGSALVRWMLHLGNPFAWSSVMVRAEAVRRLGTLVRPEHELADDLDLYHRLLGIGDEARTGPARCRAEATRLGEVLVSYRWHAANTSHARRSALTDAATRVLARACGSLLGVDAAEAAALLVRHVSDREPAPDAETLRRLGGWLERLLACFLAQCGLDAAERAAVRAHAAAVWWEAVRACVRAGRPEVLALRHALPSLRSRVPLAELGGSLGAGLLRAGGRIARWPA